MPARFEGTIVYAGELEPNGRPVHVLGYENTAQSLVGGRFRRPWRHEATGNAMLLHFPAVPASMTQANVVDTERTPEILRDIVKPLEAMERQTFAWSASAPASRHVEVFRSGIYTVVLASDAGEIPDALDRVPPRKRPPLNRILFE